MPVEKITIAINLNDGKKPKTLKTQKNFETHLKMFGYNQDHIIEVIEAEAEEEKPKEQKTYMEKLGLS